MAGPRKNFALRISPELYAALERWAASDLRSVNAQIEFILTGAARRAGYLKIGKTPASQPDIQHQPDPQHQEDA